MKKHFSSGLALLLPLLFTILIINFIINLLTHPFLGGVQKFVEEITHFQNPLFSILHTTWIMILSKGIILILLFFCVLLVGLVGEFFLVSLLFRLGSSLMQRLPIINKIYKACQEVVNSLFSDSSKKFKQVVLVPFPNEGTLCLGLVANETIKMNCRDEDWGHVASVFVPGAPNPSTGYLLIYKKEQLTFVSMTVEEAMKFIVSCGIALSDFEIIQPYEMYDNSSYHESDLLPCER